MSLFQVAVKNAEVVVFTTAIEAECANDAANRACKMAQVQFNSVEVYGAYDDEDSAPVLAKIIRP